jgi:glycine dehydrogenase subunit 1
MSKFTPHTEDEIKQMLSDIGVKSVAALFSDIPADLKPKSFNLPAGMAEYEAFGKLNGGREKLSQLSALRSAFGVYDVS